MVLSYEPLEIGCVVKARVTGTNNKPLRKLEHTTTLFFLYVFIEYEYLILL
jgi:hypothetical protein